MRCERALNYDNTIAISSTMNCSTARKAVVSEITDVHIAIPSTCYAGSCRRSCAKRTKNCINKGRYASMICTNFKILKIHFNCNLNIKKRVQVQTISNDRYLKILQCKIKKTSFLTQFCWQFLYLI